MNTDTYYKIIDDLLLDIVKVEDIYKDKTTPEYMELINTYMLNVMDLCKNNTTKEYFLKIAEHWDKTKSYENEPDLDKQLQLAQKHIFVAYKHLNSILTSGYVIDFTSIPEANTFYHPNNGPVKVGKYKNTLKNARKILNGYASISVYIDVENLSDKDFDLIVNYLCESNTRLDAESLITYFNTFKPSEKRDALSGIATTFVGLNFTILDDINKNNKKFDKLDNQQSMNYVEELYRLKQKGDQ